MWSRRSGRRSKRSHAKAQRRQGRQKKDRLWSSLASLRLCVRSENDQMQTPVTTVRAVCPHDCPDTCGLVATVQDGRAVKLRGDAEHPFTRGFLCQKVSHYLERVY